MIVLDPDRLSTLGDDELPPLAAARECVVAVGAGRVAGPGAAALLLSDYGAATRDSAIVIDSPAAWAGVVWRLGDQALELLPGGHAGAASGFCEIHLDGGAAQELGLVDELFSGGWAAWLERWLENRSTVALDAAALLTARRGGDALERAEFARLFVTGEPQAGMDRFFAGRRSRRGC